MMKKFLTIAALCLALIMLLSLTACGSEANTYTVTFNANGGELDGNATVEVKENEKITGAPTASKDGFTFDGWFDAATGGTEIDLSTYTVTKDVTLYAGYTEIGDPEPETYTVTFDANGGALSGDATIAVEEGQKITNAPTANKDGFTFDGWFDAATDGAKIDLATYVVTESVTLYAQYTEIEKSELNIRLEAEDAEISGTPSYGDTFVESVEIASGGKSVGNFGTAGNTITFTFSLDEAIEAEILFCMSSTNVDWTAGMTVVDHLINDSVITVALNGTKIDYEEQTIHGSNQAMGYNIIWETITMGTQSFNAGTNTIVITAMGQAPNIDYCDITTSGGGSSVTPEPEGTPYEKAVSFDMIVGSYEGGPAIEKAVLHFEDAVAADALTDDLFNISFASQDLSGRPQTAILGQGSGQTVYLSDETGNKVDTDTADHVTVEYTVSYGMWSFNGNLSPFTYQTVNTWNDPATYDLDINSGKSLDINGTKYTEFTSVTSPDEWTVPDLDAWDTAGTYSEGDITLTYGSYGTDDMKSDGAKNPLIIWLHGAGEGGTDPSIAILGNQVTNLAKDVIQDHFVTDTVKGAYVLAPQTPTMWMDGGDGEYSNDVASQYYVKALKGLIDAYIKDNGDIDTDRIYIGGCSNGGFMTVNMILNYPDFFAAAYPICEAYPTGDISADKVDKIKDLPIWFTHSTNDNTVKIADNGTQNDVFTNALYIDLINAGAKNVHYSLFESVNVNGVNYDGHWSWIYALRDECINVQPAAGADGDMTVADLDPASTEKVQVNGKDATLWGWLAAQSKA